MDSQINTPITRMQLTCADIDRVTENIALIAPPAPRLTSTDYVMAKRVELLQRIGDGHTTTSLAAAMKAQGLPPISPRRLADLLELPRRRKTKSSTKKRSTSDA